MGFYQPHEALSRFLLSAQQEFKIPIRWGAFTPPGFPPWHSPEQPLTHLPPAWQPPAGTQALGRWALSHHGWAQLASHVSSAQFPLPWALFWQLQQ